MGNEIDIARNMDDLQQKLDAAYDCEVAGKLDEALQLCVAVIQVDPDLAEVYNLQGIVFEQLGRKQEAFESYDRAVQLDPDFEEANENLADLQAEIGPQKSEEDVVYVEGRDAYKEDAIYVAKWGALAFGLCFGMIAIINTTLFYVNNVLLDPQLFWERQLYGTSLIQTWIQDSLEFLYPILLVGLATAVLGSVSNRKPLLFSIVGGLGYAIGNWFGWTIVFEWVAQIPTQYTSFNIFLITGLASVIMGAIWGAAIGLVTKDKTQIGWLACAGVLGVLVQDIGFRISRVFSPLSSMSIFPHYEDPSLSIVLIGFLPGLILSVITGALIGVFFGGVLGWFSDEVVVDEEDEELVEGLASLN